MRRFVYLSAGLLCLALALLIGFHIGQGTAGAQSGSSITGMSMTSYTEGPGIGTMFVITPSGDCFSRQVNGPGLASGPARSLGNFWDSGVTTIQPSTWSEIKAKFASPK